MAKEKTTGFFFKMSPKENEYFERRMKQAGFTNKSAFIRKMCIDGHVIQIDFKIINEILRLFGIAGNNLNQLTRRVNSGDDAHREDISDLNGEFKEIRLYIGQMLTMLSECTNTKPGNKFMMPMTVRDLPEYSKQAPTTESE
jgi:hypothetical protein